MTDELKEHLISYLKSVRATRNMPVKAAQELDNGIKLLNKSNHITFPHPNDSSYDTVETVRKMMDNFFNKYPDIMATKEQIDLQELNFQRFIQNTRLLKTSRAPKNK